jgi:hypothetical protein
MSTRSARMPQLQAKPAQVGAPVVFVLGAIFGGGVVAAIVLSHGDWNLAPALIDARQHIGPLYAGRRSRKGEPLCWN